MTPDPTVAQALRAAAAALADHDAMRGARLLMAHHLGVTAERLLPADHAALPDAHGWAGLIARRLAGEPLTRIIGARDFWGRTFRVTPAVLDPRPDTETLIAAMLKGPAPARLLDLGTGSGILAVTLLAEWPMAHGVATDISAAALAVAGDNAQRHGVAARLDLRQADWWDGVTGQFDLIVANPPYIAIAEMPGLAPEVRDHDPHLALTDGADGLTAYRVIIAGLVAHLAPGGRVALEIGWTQGAAVAAMLADAGLTDIILHPDMETRDRMVTARRA